MPGNLIENGSPRAAQTKADNTRSTVSEIRRADQVVFAAAVVVVVAVVVACMRMALGTFRARAKKKKFS